MNKIKSFTHWLLLGLILFSSTSMADKKLINIAGWGGNDVVAVNKLLTKVIKSELDELNIEVRYFPVESDYGRYILNSLSAGNAPDAFYVNVDLIDSWVSTGQLKAFSDSFAANAQRMNPVLLDAFTVDNQLFGVPKDVNSLALQFNIDVFKDAKTPVPDENDTWLTLREKLVSVVEAIGDEGVLGTCLSADFAHFSPFALSTGWRPFNEEGKTVLDDNFKRAFNFYVSLVHDGLAIIPADIGQNWPGGCFGTENFAVVMEGQWLSGYLVDKSPNLLYQSTLIPADPKTGERGNMLFTVGWAINNNTANASDVEKVIALLTSDKAQRAILAAGLALPSSNTIVLPAAAEDSPSEQMAQTILTASTLDNVIPYKFGRYGKNWQTPIDVALTAAMLKQLTIEQALSEAQRKYDEMIMISTNKQQGEQ